MEFNTALVHRVAKLARIHIDDEDAAPLADELGHILSWMEQLNQVDTQDVAPLASVVGTTLPWREDVVTEENQAEVITANAPEKAYGCFVVPKVVE